MTDRDLPEGFEPVPDAGPIDELASALVDGEATATEQGRANEPDVAARVAAFEAVAQEVRAGISAPSDRARDTAIARALEALDAEVVPIDRRRPGRWLPVIGAAAAVAMAVLGIGVLARGGDDAGDETAADAATQLTAAAGESGGDAGNSTFESEADDARDDGADTEAAVPGPEDGGVGRTTEEGAADSAAPAAGGGSASFAPERDLGDVASAPDLADALRDALDAEPLPDGSTAPPEFECASFFASHPLAVFTARIAETSVIVGLFEAPSASYGYVALDTDACEQVTAGEL